MEYRTFDGSNKNVAKPQQGAANTPLLRQTTVAYADGVTKLAQRRAGKDDINPRKISNVVCGADRFDT